MSKRARLLMIIWIIMVLAQVFLVRIFAVGTTHALDCIRYATAVYDGSAFMAGAPFMSLLGLISRGIGLHPLVIVNEVLPFINIPLAYAAYWLFISRFAGDNKEMCYKALCYLAFMNFFGYQSKLQMPITLLTGYFTFAGVLVHIVIPVVASIVHIWIQKYESVKAAKKDETDTDYEDNETDDDYQEEWDMKKHRIVNARNLAIGLGVLAVVLLVFVYVLNSKINKLYDATVNLQSEINASCRIYEHAPNGTVDAYVVLNTDGSITVVGGGRAENAAGLADIIKEHGNEVRCWYLYGESDADRGAYDRCINEWGIDVTNAYVINRTDIN